VANDASNNVSILLGTGTGAFGAATNFPAGTRPQSVTGGDFNRDGRPDLAVANFGSNNISILLGTGTGTFGAATNFPVGNNPRSVAVGDFNADGRLDLAVANFNGNNVSILLGTGTGTFGAATNFPVGANPRSLAVADFNADGDLDLAVANIVGDNVSILLGSGTGSFGAATNFPVGNGPISVATGDFNADGKTDIAAANIGANPSIVSILLGTGTGSFAGPVNFATGNNLRSVAAADFNHDGKLDLAVANSVINSVSILRQSSSVPVATIITHPATQLVLSGTSVSFTVAATGGVLTYQWRRNGVNLVNGGPISGATTPTLTINPVTLTDNGASFVCIVTNACGLTASNSAGLAVANIPIPSCLADVASDSLDTTYNPNGSVGPEDLDAFIAAFINGC